MRLTRLSCKTREYTTRHTIQILPITPVRIAADCSMPLMVGDLFGIILHFRLHRYTLSTDIEKAFLPLCEQDWDFTRFIW